MARTFQSLGELGGWIADHGLRVVDPGLPLSEAAASRHVWASQPSVRKVVDFIARNMASTPLHHYERVSDTERRRLSGSPIATMLRQPSMSPLVTPYRFWHNVLVDRLIYDRWCAKRVLADGREYLERIPARRVHFKVDALDRVVAVMVYGKDGKAQELDPAGFVFDVGYSTHVGESMSGTSPMDTLKDILDEVTESVSYRRGVWKRGARIPGYIHRPTPWPADGKARERFEQGWRAFESGGGREGGTPLLEDGMEYRKLDAFSASDMQTMEGRKLADVEVASAYHIAPELVGAREGTFSNIDAYRQMLYGPSLGPYFVEWEQSLNAAFADGDTYIEANVDAKLRGSFLEQASVTSTATGAPWMTRNEARARRNLPPVDGGDELVTPLNVLVGGQASPRDSGSQNEKPKSKARVVGIKAVVTEAQETQVERVVKAFFGRQARSVLSAIGSGGDWWDAKRWNDELAVDLSAVSHALAEVAGTLTAEALGYEPGAYDPAMTVNFLAAVAQDRATGVNETTKAQLDEAIASDVDPAEVFETAENSRAVALAASVATFSAAFGTVEAAKQIRDAEGVETTKTWITGSNPRASHARMNGETVPVDEKFSNGMDWPGQGDADDAGCNCSVTIQA